MYICIYVYIYIYQVTHLSSGLSTPKKISKFFADESLLDCLIGAENRYTLFSAMTYNSNFTLLIIGVLLKCADMRLVKFFSTIQRQLYF